MLNRNQTRLLSYARYKENEIIDAEINLIMNSIEMHPKNRASTDSIYEIKENIIAVN